MNGKGNIIVKCDNCGTNVKRVLSKLKNNKHTFCCKDCLHEYQRIHKEFNPNYRGYETTKCDNCGKEITVRKYEMERSKHHFCSSACTIAYIANKKNSGDIRYRKLLHHKVCAFCGKEFDTYKYRKIYCSEECSKNSAGQTTLVCDYCGEEFKRLTSLKNQLEGLGQKHHFCSSGCRQLFFVRENSPLWIRDKEPDRRYRNLSLTKEWRNEVFKRDNYTCQLCGDTSKKGHRVTLNAHHIVKFSSSKELRYVVDNGITLCKSCHEKTYHKEEKFEDMFRQIINNKKKKIA